MTPTPDSRPPSDVTAVEPPTADPSNVPLASVDLWTFDVTLSDAAVEPVAPVGALSARSAEELFPLPARLLNDARALLDQLQDTLARRGPGLLTSMVQIPLDTVDAWAHFGAVTRRERVGVLVAVCRALRAAGYDRVSFVGPQTIDSTGIFVETTEGRMGGATFLRLTPADRAKLVPNKAIRDDVVERLGGEVVTDDDDDARWMIRLSLV